MKLTYNDYYIIYQLINDEKNKIKTLQQINDNTMLEYQYNKMNYLQNKVFVQMLDIDKTQTKMDLNYNME